MRGAYYNEFDPEAAQWLRCVSCQESKPADQFSVDTSRPRGRKYRCKACLSASFAKRYAENPEKYRLAVKLSRERNLARALVDGARKRAKAKKIAFDLDQHLDEIRARLDAGLCEATGIPFQIGMGHHWASPSIDRIEPRGPYLYDNIRIVLHGFNNALGNWGEDILFAMVDARRAAK